LTVDTKGYRGNVSKSARILINNPRDKIHHVSVGAFVRQTITVSPENVLLAGKPGEIVVQTVEIRAGKNKNLTLGPLPFDLDHNISYTVETVKKGRLYRVHLTNRPGPAESYRGLLKLKTNYPERPELTIRIRGRFHN
jgi:hypothetical protein